MFFDSAWWCFTSMDHASFLFLTVAAFNNDDNDLFYIATYHSHEGSQTALQSIFTLADQLILYIEMLSLKTLHRNAFNGPLARYPSHLGKVRK